MVARGPCAGGEDQSGARLGRARFALSETFFQILALKLDASYWGDNDENPLDLTETYLELRPYPRAGFRTRVKAGAFYAPLSLANHASGWESPYTLSYSALDSWVAEELRTIGLQADIDWLGTKLGHSVDVGLTGAVFGWNEPAGVSLAMHGFAVDTIKPRSSGAWVSRAAGRLPGLKNFTRSTAVPAPTSVSTHAISTGSLSARCITTIMPIRRPSIP